MIVTSKMALTETYETLKILDREEYNKIPNEVIKIIEENKDNDYVWKYNSSKSIEEQDLSREAIAFLSYINLEYLLTGEKKKLMERIFLQNEIIDENEKRKKYEVFSSNINKKQDLKQNIEILDSANQNNSMIVVKEKKQNLFISLIKKIFEFFNVTN